MNRVVIIALGLALATAGGRSQEHANFSGSWKLGLLPWASKEARPAESCFVPLSNHGMNFAEHSVATSTRAGSSQDLFNSHSVDKWWTRRARATRRGPKTKRIL
jgi:hypothetical protein